MLAGLRLSLAVSVALFAGASGAEEPRTRIAAGSAEHGAKLIEQKGCGGCHTIPGIADAKGLVGPPLMWMGRRTFIAGMLRNTPANLAAWVYDPQRFVPGNAMPSTGLTPDEAADVAAYLETLR